MPIITRADLARFAPRATPVIAEAVCDHADVVLPKWGINTGPRLWMLMAMLSVESAGFSTLFGTTRLRRSARSGRRTSPLRRPCCMAGRWVRKLEKLPGGRALVFAIPIVWLVLGKLFLDDETITPVGNVTSLALCLAMLSIYRESPLIFMHETESASTQWRSMGTFSLVVVTVVNIGHSQWLRTFGIPVDPDSFFSVIRIGYAFAFGCLFIVPQARESVIPPRGWWWLLAITAVATLGTVVATRVF